MFLNIKFFFIVFVFSLATFGGSSFAAKTKNINTEKFQYLFPVPGSILNSTGTNIIIRFGEAFNDFGLDNCLSVSGSKSGKHKVKIVLAENNRTLIFKLIKPFADGELVTLKLKNRLKTISGKIIPELQYSFETSKVNLNKAVKSDPDKYLKLTNPDFNNDKNLFFQNDVTTSERKTYTIQKDNLPADFPEIRVDSINSPTSGYIFLAPFSLSGINPPNYLIITDNYGIPVFYKKMIKERSLNFVKQPSGVLTYFNQGKYHVMDSSYNVIDSLYVKNGYETNVHECLLLPNGHSLLLGDDNEQVAMDTVVAGGDSNAVVVGAIIQELDENKDTVFEWRSWDHFKITDATYDINLTGAGIDFAHPNALEIDSDGNILLSCRNLDEITKIDRQTGDIIWRWGGQYCKNNQFTFSNDPIGFSHQHFIRRLSNGNYIIFDNGNLHSPSFSRVVEYQLDQQNKTARLISDYRNNPQTFSLAMGNGQRLENGNIFIGWGWFTSLAASEVTPDGEVALYMTIPTSMVNYRALKYEWKTNLFVADVDTLSFGIVQKGDSVTKSFTLTNNSNKEIEINGILNRDSTFHVNTSLPVIMPALGTANLQVTFKPLKSGNHIDDLYLQWNNGNNRIAQIVPMTGIATTLVPVELSSFVASLSDKNVLLTWATETETNNHLFEVERRNKNLDWMTIGFVSGHGTTTAGNNYNYTDKNVESGIYFYRLKQIDFDGSFSYSNSVEINVNMPVTFSLEQNYPNPFNPTTKIVFTIPKAGKVSLKIYDVLGEKIRTLINRKMSDGEHKIKFNALDLPSGIYIYTLRSGNFTASKKMVVLK